MPDPAKELLHNCPRCGRAVKVPRAYQILTALAGLPPGTPITLLAPLPIMPNQGYATLLAQAMRDGYPYARIDGIMIRLSGQDTPWADTRERAVELLVDWFEMPGQSEVLLEPFIARLADSIGRAFRAGAGVLVLDMDGEQIRLTDHAMCLSCGASLPESESRHFLPLAAVGPRPASMVQAQS